MSRALALVLLLAARAAAAALTDGAGLEPRLGARVPSDLVLRGEDGRPARLGSLLAGKPTVLALVYYRCPGLCAETLNGLVRGLRALSLDAGRDYRVLAVSVDPRETPALAAAQGALYRKRYGRPGAGGWSFLTGDAASVRRLADAVGYRYFYDAERGEYVHPAGATVLTPDGRVSRSLDGADFPAGDLRLALVEAASGAIGTPVDRLLLLCYRYDPARGRYGLAATRLLRAGAVLTAALLAAAVAGLRAREAA